MTNSYQQDGPRVLQIFPNTSVYQLETRLPKRLCDEINDYFINNVNPEPGRLDVSTINEDERSVNVRWCQQDDWIGPFIYQYIRQANEHLFQYDITGIYYNNVHHLQYEEGQFHGWHIDTDGFDSVAYEPPHSRSLVNQYKEYVRKLAFIIQLSDPEDYTGGEIEIEINSSKPKLDIGTVDKKRGTIVVFDPRSRHRVNAVTSGVRNALIGWVLGPRWK